MKRLLLFFAAAALVCAQQSTGGGIQQGASGGTATSVGLAMPSTFCSVTNSPVTTTGVLTCTLATGQTANLIFGTNSSGNVGLMNLTGAQLPNPSATTLGGVESLAAVSHNFLTSISTSGVPAQAQPAFSDLSGSATAAQLPNPSASTLGGVESLAATSHQWINTISTSGVPASTQPDFSDLTGSASTAQLSNLSRSGPITYSSGVIGYTSLLNLQGTSGAVTGTSSAVTLWSYTIPANTIPATGCAIFEAMTNHSTGTASVTYQLNVGSASVTASNSSAGVAQQNYKFCNTGSTAAGTQTLARVYASFPSGLAAPTVALNQSVASTGTIAVTFTFNGANTEAVTPDLFTVTLLQ